ncbi:hypothetical protein HDU85_001858 [Gaertneriomyces sp. JEL0708]|nr:hypothetical protein HDU85_001858 [Gaertneriomyces sp. JEL0708]
MPILLSYLRSQLGLPHDTIVDLASETGEVCDLWAPSKQKDYALKWVTGGTWVGVKVGLDGGDDSPHYTSLLDNPGEKLKFSTRRTVKPNRTQRMSISEESPSTPSATTPTSGTSHGRRNTLTKGKTGSQASLSGKKKSKK